MCSVEDSSLSQPVSTHQMAASNHSLVASSPSAGENMWRPPEKNRK